MVLSKIAIEETTEYDQTIVMNTSNYMSNMNYVDMQDERAWQLLHELPRLSVRRAYGACAMNVVIPGSGTMFAAMNENASQSVRQTQLWVALFQLLSATQIVGSAWSIYWGILMVQAAQEDEARRQRDGASVMNTSMRELDLSEVRTEQKSLLQKMGENQSQRTQLNSGHSLSTAPFSLRSG